MSQDIFDVLILGAGAAGLVCAKTAAAQGLATAVADAAPLPGRKVRLAGGGMGNMTNKNVSSVWYVGKNPEFTTSALRKFPFRAAAALAESCRFPLEEREYGQFFGLHPVSKFVESLTEQCVENETVFFMRRTVTAAHKEGELFTAFFSDAEPIRAKALVLALGSPAWASSGGTDTGLAIARHFGHACTPFYPVLTPLILPETHPFRGLQGITAEVGFRAGSQYLVRPMLFTHKGISGPAGLIASCFWRPGGSLNVDFLPNPDYAGQALFEGNDKRTASGVLRRALPQRLADALLSTAQSISTEPLKQDRPLAEWNKRQRSALSAAVHECNVTPTRSEGLRAAEAAAGGVLTETVNPRTMESLLVKNLFIIGELLDIAGLLGGFNLHWAFACGTVAGNALHKNIAPEDRTRYRF